MAAGAWHFHCVFLPRTRQLAPYARCEELDGRVADYVVLGQVQEKLAISIMQEEERRMFDTMHEAEYRRMETRWE